MSKSGFFFTLMLMLCISNATSMSTDLKLFKILSHRDQVISYLSADQLLSMLYVGANGETKKEIQAVCNYEDNLDEFLKNYPQKMFATTVTRDSTVSLYQANRIWYSKNLPLKEGFLMTASEIFKSELSKVNFEESEKIRKNINTWVEEQTNNKIKNLIIKGLIDPMTKMVLVNTLYFKADWNHPFNKKESKMATFKNFTGDHQVMMMHQKHNFLYLEQDSLQFIQMPYKDNNYSFNVILPKSDLHKAVSDLSDEMIRNLESNARKIKVSVFLPKFKIEKKYDLKSLFYKLGLKLPFSNDADFSNMLIPGKIKNRIFVSDFIQKTFLDVSEEGTEAAAATAAVMRMTSIAPSATPVFRADSPFIFYIKNKQTDRILFIGKYNGPASAENNRNNNFLD